MAKYYEAIEFVKASNGILFSKDFEKAKISRYHIRNLIEHGVIEKISDGKYLRHDTFEDEFYILQNSNPTVIFSYNTAIYLHHLAEKTPTSISVTVYKGYNASHLTNKADIHYVNKVNHKLGATLLKSPQGFEVVAYDLERITCDLIRSNNIDIDTEQKNKFLKTVFLEHKLNTITLIQYAKKLKCEKKVRTIMEVFL